MRLDRNDLRASRTSFHRVLIDVSLMTSLDTAHIATSNANVATVVRWRQVRATHGWLLLISPLNSPPPFPLPLHNKLPESSVTSPLALKLNFLLRQVTRRGQSSHSRCRVLCNVWRLMLCDVSSYVKCASMTFNCSSWQTDLFEMKSHLRYDCSRLIGLDYLLILHFDAFVHCLCVCVVF